MDILQQNHVSLNNDGKTSRLLSFWLPFGELIQKLGITFVLHIVLCKLYLKEVKKEERPKICHSCDKARIKQPLKMLFLAYKNVRYFQEQQT
jgi:hypothetical protein